MEQPLLIKNFVSEQTANKIIKFIDDNIDKFVYNQARCRWMMRFGYDEELPEQSLYDISLVSDIKDDLIKIFDDTKSLLSADQNLTSWFLSKQHNGGKLLPHVDGNQGINEHLDYTAMLYLNTLSGNGSIGFPELDISITPELGDLIVFKAKEHRHEVSEITENRYSIPMWFTSDTRYTFVIE